MRRRFVLGLTLWAPVLVLAQDAPPGAGEVPRITQQDFKKAWKSGAILVIDVRDTGSYGVGHIPGALSVPESKLAEHFEELKSQQKPIVAYCGWVSEHTSARVALALDGLGIKGVRALLGGYRQWTADGNPTVTGTSPR